MKKKLISALLLSTVVLTSASTALVAVADETDDKIASQDAKIASTKSAEATAQSEVAGIQSQVSSLSSKQAALKKETEDLLAESKKLQVKIDDLTKEIKERDEALKAQGRSAQTDGSATSYVDAVINSKSLSDVVTRVSAMRTVVKANNDMMKQQETAKADLDKAVKTNQAKSNEGYKLLAQMDDQAKTLETQQAQLKVAQLNLAAERATAEGDKASLLEQKAAAQAAAQAAAAREKAYNDQVADAAAKAKEQTDNGASIDNNVPTPSPGGNDNGGYTPAPTPTPTPPPPGGGGGANTYPEGECTWGAKILAPWAGNYWGNGGDWAASAARAGFRTGSVPQVGAIAVWQGGYGHVAVVYQVSGNKIAVQESNYARKRYIADHRGGLFDPGAVTYIYPN
ncbi:MAG: peptidoglycan hydrolase PcsB [Pseudolactococcus laudensis]|uniref:peptidoglycan hydrolase PcsB n=1 Tax=Pseudolactococcus laudensis TaxID=1494461 RepID=UPI003F9D3751